MPQLLGPEVISAAAFVSPPPPPTAASLPSKATHSSFEDNKLPLAVLRHF